MQQGITNALTPYVTSAFQEHSLTATTGIVANIVAGLIKLPLAKVLDIWGRPQGIISMLISLIVGLIMMAGCNNVTTYAAAQVFYWVGYNGVSYSLDVFIADTSSLKNRSLMFAFVSAPYIATTWISGPAAQSFLHGAGWRWGFGTFCIVTPVIFAPLLILFYINHRRATKAGLLPHNDSGRTLLHSLKYYAIEFDVIGILILAGGLALFLLPFSLYSYQAKGWASALVISMLVVGFVLLIFFPIYEKYIAPKTFVPFHILLDRTVMGACILSATLFVEFYIWDSYFTSFLQVVNNLTVTEASYVANIYSIGSCFWSIVVGFLIRYTGRFKWLALYFGVPLTILGCGLMIHFRQPNENVGYIVMCQIFIALAGGTLVICEQMAAMASVTHQHVAVILAILGMFSSIGGAIGQTVAAAIWTSNFPTALAKYLPADEQQNLVAIYGELTTQLSYPVGSPTRLAIQRAYGDAQRWMLIASTTVLVLAVVSVAVWRDIKVKDFKQVKGRVV